MDVECIVHSTYSVLGKVKKCLTYFDALNLRVFCSLKPALCALPGPWAELQRACPGTFAWTTSSFTNAGDCIDISGSSATCNRANIQGNTCRDCRTLIYRLADAYKTEYKSCPSNSGYKLWAESLAQSPSCGVFALNQPPQPNLYTYISGDH